MLWLRCSTFPVALGAFMEIAGGPQGQTGILGSELSLCTLSLQAMSISFIPLAWVAKLDLCDFFPPEKAPWWNSEF